jgi:hypothetical protein
MSKKIQMELEIRIPTNCITPMIGGSYSGNLYSCVPSNAADFAGRVSKSGVHAGLAGVAFLSRLLITVRLSQCFQVTSLFTRHLGKGCQVLSPNDGP